MRQYTRLRAVIDLDAVKQNLEQMRRNLNEGTRIMAVLKTDAYGHGAIPIAGMLENREEIWGYAVATVDEGLSLRRAGMKKPILCLGCVFPDEYEAVIAQDIRVNVYTKEMAAALSEKAVEWNRQVYVHVKIDTAMSRLGFSVSCQSLETIQEIAGLPGIVMEGLFTHFSSADETDKTISHKQLEQYLWMKEQLEERGIIFSDYHVSNSAGIIELGDVGLNLVRAGIAMFGLYPSNEVKKECVELKPAMQIFAHVTFVKWIEKGMKISYGGTFEAKQKMRIATIPMGYGDGYPRSLSNKGYVLIHGKKAPIVGRVCMDQFMVDVTEIPETQFGDLVTIVGANCQEYLSVDVLSELSDRFHYEFICDINKRVPREYLWKGEVVYQKDYFTDKE